MARTRRKFLDIGAVKLPLPQYSSSRSVLLNSEAVVQSTAKPSIFWQTAPRTHPSRLCGAPARADADNKPLPPDYMDTLMQSTEHTRRCIPAALGWEKAPSTWR